MKRALLLLIPLWLLMCILTFSCAGPNQPDDNIYVTNVMVTKWYNIHEGAISITHDYGPVNSDQSQAVLIEVLDRGLTIDYEFLSAPQHIWNSKATFINEFCIPNNIQFFGHGHLHNDHDALSYDDRYVLYNLYSGGRMIRDMVDGTVYNYTTGGVPIWLDCRVTSGGVDGPGKLFQNKTVSATVAVIIVFSPFDQTPQGQESPILT